MIIIEWFELLQWEGAAVVLFFPTSNGVRSIFPLCSTLLMLLEGFMGGEVLLVGR